MTFTVFCDWLPLDNGNALIHVYPVIEKIKANSHDIDAKLYRWLLRYPVRPWISKYTYGDWNALGPPGDNKYKYPCTHVHLLSSQLSWFSRTPPILTSRQDIEALYE